MWKSLLTVIVCSLGLAACGWGFGWMSFWDSGTSRSSERSSEARIAAALAAPDRPADDLARDQTRHASAVLALADVKPGERVLDLGAAGGYMTWMLSSLAGPEGSVTAQDPRAWLDEYPTLWPMTVALATARPNVSHQVMDFDALAGEAGSYDVAVMSLVYHEAARMGADRAAMNREIYNLLKPGGRLLVVDHHATPGSGERDVYSYHRIDAELVRREIEAAGFRLEREADELENAEDDLSLNIFDPTIRGRTSQFALLFRKPRR
jgi:predicted methyltransferase